MRQVVVVVLALAGCDGVFDLDRLHVPVDATAPQPDDVRFDSSPLDTGLVLHLQLDNNLVDEVTGNPASCAAGALSCPQFAAGRLGGAALYDGADDCLTADLATVGTVFTASLWFQVTSDTSGSLIAKPYTGTLDSWQIAVDTGHTLSFVSFAGGNATAIAIPAAFSEATWTHVAITYDNAVRQVFVSGVKRASGGPSAFAINTDPVYIGCDRDSGSTTQRMTGLVDDVRVYSRVLTAGEIGALANM